MFYLVGINSNYFVWKTFWIIGFSIFAAALSSSSTASCRNDHPVDPRFSLACSIVLAPGIGTVPLQIAQLMATCVWDLPYSAATACSVPRSPCAPGKSSRNSCRRGLPCRGRLSKVYFPVKRPKQSGLYEISRQFRSLQVSVIPCESLYVINEYCIWAIERGTSRSSKYAATFSSCRGP